MCTLTLGGFCLMGKRVNALTGRWKHVCRISCKVANTELTWHLSGFPSRIINSAFLCLHLRTALNMATTSWTERTFTTCQTERNSCRSLSALPSCSLPGRPLVLFLVSNLYFFFILSQPCYGTLPIPPSSNKTSVVYLLQPFNGKTPDLPVFLSFFFANF